MPITINLLAEAKVEEDLRRRDPVKRALWAALLLVCLMLLWSSTLYIRIIGERSVLTGMQDQLASQGKDYKQLLANEKDLADINHKLGDLEKIYTSRFLWGPLLNSLQQSVINDVQLLSFHGDQSYVLTAESKPVLNDTGRLIASGKAGGVTERMMLEWNASDSSATPGDQVGKYKEALSKTEFFSNHLDKTSEITLKKPLTPVHRRRER